jgi:hypothetical protein
VLRSPAPRVAALLALQLVLCAASPLTPAASAMASEDGGRGSPVYASASTDFLLPPPGSALAGAFVDRRKTLAEERADTGRCDVALLYLARGWNAADFAGQLLDLSVHSPYEWDLVAPRPLSEPRALHQYGLHLVADSEALNAMGYRGQVVQPFLTFQDSHACGAAYPFPPPAAGAAPAVQSAWVLFGVPVGPLEESPGRHVRPIADPRTVESLLSAVAVGRVASVAVADDGNPQSRHAVLSIGFEAPAEEMGSTRLLAQRLREHGFVAREGLRIRGARRPSDATYTGSLSVYRWVGAPFPTEASWELCAVVNVRLQASDVPTFSWSLYFAAQDSRAD